jgi:hypothetical protein
MTEKAEAFFAEIEELRQRKNREDLERAERTKNVVADTKSEEHAPWCAIVQPGKSCNCPKGWDVGTGERRL